MQGTNTHLEILQNSNNDQDNSILQIENANDNKDSSQEDQNESSYMSKNLNSDSEYQQDTSNDKEVKYNMKMFDSFNEQQECHQILKNITQDFKLSYLKIKDFQELQQPPLKFQKKKNLQYLIRYWRQKQQREGNQDKISQQQNSGKNITKKRKFREDDPEYKDICYHKKQKTDQTLERKIKEQSLAMSLISNFESLEETDQHKILKSLNNILIKDSDLLYNTIQQQVLAHAQKAKELYGKHLYNDLITLLQSLSPQVSILLNIQMSLTNHQYTEESNTLSKTLLPFLNHQYDYTFIQSKDHFILTRFLNSLIVHIMDNKVDIKQGFILFVLYMDAKRIHQLIHNEKNKNALVSSLHYLGFSQKAVTLLSSNVNQLIWPGVLAQLTNKDEKNYHRHFINTLQTKNLERSWTPFEQIK